MFAARLLQRQASRLYSTAPEKWDLFAGVIVERLPIVSKTFQPLEKQFQDYLWKVEYENSLKSDHEMQHEKELLQAQLLKKGKLEMDLDEISSSQTAQDKKDAYIEEFNKFNLADRTTPDDKANIVKSTNRKLEEILYLLVEQKFGSEKTGHFVMPQGKRQDGETMRQTAERVVAEVCGDKLKPKFYGNAPVGFYKYKYPKKAAVDGNSVGAKVFFYRSTIAGSESTTIKDEVKYEWLDKDAVNLKLKGSYSESVQKFMF